MTTYGVFKCPVDHQKYTVTDDNLQQTVEHVRKHAGYEQMDEQWVKDRCVTKETE